CWGPRFAVCWVHSRGLLGTTVRGLFRTTVRCSLDPRPGYSLTPKRALQSYPSPLVQIIISVHHQSHQELATYLTCDFGRNRDMTVRAQEVIGRNRPLLFSVRDLLWETYVTGAPNPVTRARLRAEMEQGWLRKLLLVTSDFSPSRKWPRLCACRR